MYGVVQASPEEQIVPDLFCLFIPSTESICHIPQELRLVTVPESVHPRQSRVICSFMEVAAILTMWLFILAMVRLYMPATRPPVLLSPMLSIEVLSVLQDFLEIKGLHHTVLMIYCQSMILAPCSVNGHSDLLLSNRR